MLPSATGRPSLTWWFFFFLGSGFAGLVYEVVWLRLAMAAFGVTTPLVSIVLSVFMAGLALGSWLGGRLSARGVDARRGLVRYAAAEAAIGVLALAVPSGLRAGHALFAASGTTLAWDSAAYHLVSGVLVALTLLPCCTAMGATFPLAMAAIRTAHPDAGPRAFSFLYLANVLGAACGTLASAFVLVELLGFRATLAIAVAVNVLVAATAFARSRRLARAPAMAAALAAPPETAAIRVSDRSMRKAGPLTRGHVGAIQLPTDNRKTQQFQHVSWLSDQDSNQSMHFICIAFSRRKTRAKLRRHDAVGSRPEIQCRISNTGQCPRHEKVCAILVYHTPTVPVGCPADSTLLQRIRFRAV